MFLNKLLLQKKKKKPCLNKICLSCIKPLKGANPVPGPTIIIGIFRDGR